MDFRFFGVLSYVSICGGWIVSEICDSGQDSEIFDDWTDELLFEIAIDVFEDDSIGFDGLTIGFSISVLFVLVECTLKAFAFFACCYKVI